MQDIGSVGGRRRRGVVSTSCGWAPAYLVVIYKWCSQTSSSRRHHEVVSHTLSCCCHRRRRWFSTSCRSAGSSRSRREELMEASQAVAHRIWAEKQPAAAEGSSKHKLCKPEQLRGSAGGQRARWLAQQGVLRGRVHLPARRMGGEGGRVVWDGLCEAVLGSVRERLSRCHRN